MLPLMLLHLWLDLININDYAKFHQNVASSSESESESELLLVTRSNDNHLLGPVMREVSP